jgi:hypothetical protein
VHSRSYAIEPEGIAWPPTCGAPSPCRASFHNEGFGEGNSESTPLLKKMDLGQEPVGISSRIQVEGEVVGEG